MKVHPFNLLHIQSELNKLISELHKLITFRHKLTESTATRDEILSSLSRSVCREYLSLHYKI